MSSTPTDAVIRFEPDGFDLGRPWLLGRQSAGHGFLRAAVAGRGEGPVYGVTAHLKSAQVFEAMVRGFDPAAEPEWIRAEQIGHVGKARGVLYLADPALPTYARLRQRVGLTNHSLCGVTHTLSSAGTMQGVADLLSEAVAPWDALICTSQAALETVQKILAAQADYLRWRFGPATRLSFPQLPVIPLGVHAADFAFTDDDKVQARRTLGLADDEIAALYVGRLVYAGKAHPLPMFLGLQAVAQRTGKKLALILCGRAPTELLAGHFLAGAARYAPDVRVVMVDSREDADRRGAWAAGDIFMSLADGIQETFGLTPVEAMAACLPVVVSDWDGYKDTVRDGVDGFRIATWAPEPGIAGASYALRHQLGVLDYDNYCWAAAAATSVDLAQLVDQLTALVEQPDLRRRMGQAGQARVRETFDWSHIYRQYQALWGELNARRASAAQRPEELAWAQAAPKVAPARLDPFESFGHYPTSRLGPQTAVALVPGATVEAYRQRTADDLFPFAGAPEAIVLPIWAELEKGPATVAALSAGADLSVGWGFTVIGTLAKMGLVALANGGEAA